MSDVVIALVAFMLAIQAGTLVEYGLHRWVLHARRRTFVAHRHRMHHKSNVADTPWGDFRDFYLGAIPLCWLGLFHSAVAGVGFLLGGAVYVLLLAQVHKLSDERPGLIFWMPRNSHELHHSETPRHSFGIITRLWDRVFGTYTNTIRGARTP